MFRKLVSSLSFSPALITQVGFYAHRLRQEEVTRRLTLVFVALALVVQSLAVFAPPESANASSEQDLIRGGITTLDDLLVRYDKNTEDIRDIYTTLGVDRAEIAAAKQGIFNSKNNIYSVSRYGQYSPEQGETSFSYKRSSGGVGIRYISPLALADTSDVKQRSGTEFEAFIGESTKLGWFAIMKSNASLATKGYPSTIIPDSGTATSTVVKNISALNVTQGTKADEVVSKPFDKISYTLTAQNTGKKTAQLPLSINLSDILEYSTLVDGGGGSFDNSTESLSWPAVSIASGTTQERTFVVQLKTDIPATATGQSNGNSFDCVMAASYGSDSRTRVECPAIKGVESIIGDLPSVGIAANVIFSLVLIITVVFFYIRTHQMKKEIRLIRHNVNTGTI
jgi:hypothetical protein